MAREDQVSASGVRGSGIAALALTLCATAAHGQDDKAASKEKPAAPAAAPAPAVSFAWSTGPALAIPRDHHATFLVRSKSGDFLYVAGGTNYKEFYDDVSRAKIQPDGSVGGWESVGKLPTPRGGISVVVADGHAVLTGGQTGTEGMKGLQRIAEVYVARIGDDGELGEWKAAPALPAPRFHHPALFHNGWIYVVGGQGATASEGGVFGARVGMDGSIAQWVELKPLPRPRSHHASFIYDNHVYAVAGLDGIPGSHTAIYVDILRAPIQPDGTLGDWRIVSGLPHSYATHAAFGHDGNLWVIGGVEDNARFVDTVLRAPLAADGRVGPWKAVEPGLPLARGHVHNTPMLNGRIYSAGGRIMPASPGASWVTGEVHVGTLR